MNSWKHCQMSYYCLIRCRFFTQWEFLDYDEHPNFRSLNCFMTYTKKKTMRAMMMRREEEAATIFACFNLRNHFWHSFNLLQDSHTLPYLLWYLQRWRADGNFALLQEIWIKFSKLHCAVYDGTYLCMYICCNMSNTKLWTIIVILPRLESQSFSETSRHLEWMG